MIWLVGMWGCVLVRDSVRGWKFKCRCGGGVDLDCVWLGWLMRGILCKGVIVKLEMGGVGDDNVCKGSCVFWLVFVIWCYMDR